MPSHLPNYDVRGDDVCEAKHLRYDGDAHVHDDDVRDHVLRGDDARDDEQGHKCEHILDNGSVLLHEHARGDGQRVRDYDYARDREATIY